MVLPRGKLSFVGGAAHRGVTIMGEVANSGHGQSAAVEFDFNLRSVVAVQLRPRIAAGLCKSGRQRFFRRREQLLRFRLHPAEHKSVIPDHVGFRRQLINRHTPHPCSRPRVQRFQARHQRLKFAVALLRAFMPRINRHVAVNERSKQHRVIAEFVQRFDDVLDISSVRGILR